jgi:hypothetical protein
MEFHLFVLIFRGVECQKVLSIGVVEIFIGEYISLGYREKNDLKTVIDYVRGFFGFKKIILWGRSMVYLLHLFIHFQNIV